MYYIEYNKRTVAVFHLLRALRCLMGKERVYEARTLFKCPMSDQFRDLYSVWCCCTLETHTCDQDVIDPAKSVFY